MNFYIVNNTSRWPLLVYNGKTPENELEALEISIQKWRAIVKYYQDEKNKDIFLYCGGVDTCGLCILYHHRKNKSPVDISCKSCPIYKQTGYIYCLGTPASIYTGDKAYADIKEIAKKELDFLLEIKNKMET